MVELTFLYFIIRWTVYTVGRVQVSSCFFLAGGQEVGGKANLL